jgi:ABC-type nitrate/sulfonate/bicarbonate transport system substrate-binding protein
MNTISEGLPLQEIAMTAHRAPAALYSLDSSLEDADALRGLTGAIDPKTEEASMVRAYAAQNGLDFDEDINWQFTEDAGLQSVVGGQADFVADWGTNVPEWWSQDLEPNLLWLGVELGLYGNGIISTPDYLDKEPEIAQCFVEGATKGYKYVIENGEDGRKEAVKALFDANPEVAALPDAQEFHEANLAMFVSTMLDETVKEHGLGYMVPERVDSSLAFINDYLLETPLELEDAFWMEDQLLSDGQFMIDDWDAAVASVEQIAGKDNPLFAVHPAP